MIIQTYWAIAWFFLVCLLFGISLNFFFKFTKHFDENLYKLFSLICIGFGFYGLSIIILGAFRLPLDYRLITGISAIIPLFYFIKEFQRIKSYNYKGIIKMPRIDQVIAVILFVVFFSLMVYGTFQYSWLEDGDPWIYAGGAKYVSIFKDYHAGTVHGWQGGYLFQNSPIMLPAMLGIIHQITPDLYMIMKIFINTALLLGVISFFLFAYLFSGKKKTFSIISLFILITVPCFTGHFIFNYTLSICIFLVFMLSLAFSLQEPKSALLAGMICGVVIATHPIAGIQTAINLFILVIIFILQDMIIAKFDTRQVIKNFIKSKAAIIIIIGILGMLFSLFYYADVIMHTNRHLLEQRGLGKGGVVSLNYTIGSYDLEDKNLGDFFIAQGVSRMDQEYGVGIILFTICVVGIFAILLVKDFFFKNNLIYLALFMFYFLFLWIFTGGYFHFGVQNSRWWSMLAIFIALHAAATIVILIKLLKSQKIIIYALMLILFIGIIYTSAIPRYTVQTSRWPPGDEWTSEEQFQGYLSLKDIGFNKKMFGICNNGYGVIANNQIFFPWEKDIKDYTEFMQNTSIQKNLSIITTKTDAIINNYKFDYVIIDTGCAPYIGENTTNELLQYYMAQQNKYAIDEKHSNKGFILLRVLAN